MPNMLGRIERLYIASKSCPGKHGFSNCIISL
jgi:hypothetical protein